MNKLASSKSAFLLQSANSPVNWYPWGEEAFKKAKEEDKPILVDVGASWCHWCHVMDETTYENPEVIQLINENFIAIKVDRDEDPELDKRLQTAVNTLTGESGWPLTVFMTPEGKVFFGGTFFPPEDSYGRIGFKRLLREIIRLWKNDREKIYNVVQTLDSSLQSTVLQREPAEWNKVEDVVSSIISNYDFTNGGIQGNMKFPHPTVDELLLLYSFFKGEDVEAKLSLFTLRKMYYGGIFDQVGGGFHRYTVDEEWYVPHFEKLLIDNAELLIDYTLAYQYSNDEEILDAITLTADFILREMKVNQGFANSIDADSEGKEGYYYTWTEGEFKEALKGEDYSYWIKVFNVDKGAEVEGRKVLKRTVDLNELKRKFNDPINKLSQIREKLRIFREKTRKYPFRDENKYTYPNCRMAEALLFSYPFTNKGLNEALEVINKLSKNITRRLEGGKKGLPEDYASALLAAITAYEITGELKYRDLAISLGEEVKNLNYDYPFDTPNESPASLALKGLLKLSVITGTSYVPTSYSGDSPFLSGVAYSIASYLKGIAHIVIVDENDGRGKTLHNEVLRLYHPFKVVEIVKEDSTDLLPKFIKEMVRYNKGVSRAYVCVGTTCSLPLDSIEKIKQLLKSKK
ncbi:MAG: thioredoxin domain-containing protein [Sulfolobaceae archaeon]